MTDEPGGRTRGDWLVAAQFLLLAALLLPGAPLWSAPWLTAVAAAIAIAGTALAAAGLLAIGRDIVPWVAPRPGAPLRTGGVYRFTRNPIYLGILIGAAGWVLWRARIELIVVWALLAVVLVTKARVEQRHLIDAFGDDYRAYADRTPLVLWGRGIR
ncbi:methyltransferase family protein [Microbacterium thalassium]|uniref:Protein-S-isoprenylcysteine O-methyltransferase Ste14 n=2 Tax=Microbacterium thalassium TaxID=362649 RepID=A0A7X0FR36_9MICO|nr:isoprenylcysteine carboxylmethyltransferase family protein [Microbacterium thalassium]MBB6392138.1 protein-S-isoprenylcysteine O-methyltransferase Ste14 [Microbacterium thalassium]